jgi:cytosine/uracil/thiamine/allantoin permease
MNRKTIMAMPAACFCGVAVCIIGIILGSFRDFDINVALAYKTDLGAFFGTLITYIIYAVVSTAFLKAAEKEQSIKHNSC